MFFFMQLLLSLRHDQDKKKFVFFHLATLITTLSSREKKVFFTFMYCDHYGKIKREKIFLFELATTITTPWSREKKYFFISRLSSVIKKEKWFFSFIHYDHYVMTYRENFFSFSYYHHYAMINTKKVFFFVSLLRSLAYDQERKNYFFHLPTMFTNEERKNFFFHLANTITMPWSREKKVFFI